MKQKKTLRYYQQDVCKASVNAWKRGQQFALASVFTALGKALITSALANWCLKQKVIRQDGKEYGARVLIFVPSAKLVQQNYVELIEYMDFPVSEAGIVCVKMGKKQINKRVVVAMYQSIANIIKGQWWDYILWDECHYISNDPESVPRTMLRSILRVNPNCNFLGVTATHWRLGQGYLINDCVKGKAFFKEIIYDSYVDPGIKRLVAEGHLAQIETLNTPMSIDLEGVRKTNSEAGYNQDDVGKKFDILCDKIVENIRHHVVTRGIETALVFAANVSSAKKIIEAWGDNSTIRLVCDKNTDSQNNNNFKWLEKGKGIRLLVNVRMATTGYNFPALQAIFITTATTSSALLTQIIGRLVRPYGDMIGLLGDFGSNLERLGSIDDIKIPKNKLHKSDIPQKVCLECSTLNNVSAKFCKECNAKFVASESEEGKYSMITVAQAMKIKRESKITTHKILSYEPEKCISAAGKQYVKLKFYDYDTGRLVHNEFLWLGNNGHFSSQAEAMVMFLYKDVNDFFSLGDDALDANLFCTLFIDNNEFFKRCVELKLEPQDGSKYKKIVTGSIVFE